MRQSAVLLVALLGISSAAFAQPPASHDDGTLSRAIRLSDAELDQITAGSVITVLIVPPNDLAPRLIPTGGPTIILLGGGHGGSVFGEIVMVNKNNEVNIRTIPGGH